LPSVVELDGVLGTEKWKVRNGEAPDPFEKLDQRLKAMKERRGLQASHLMNGKGERAYYRGTIFGTMPLWLR
jgi:nitrite reductase (NAD(P)H)